MYVTDHAIAQFRSQTLDSQEKHCTDEEAKKAILKLWEEGETESSKLLWVQKFKKYGLEDVEHRKAGDWVITVGQETIITVHRKTQEEYDRERELKRNAGFRIKIRNKRHKRWQRKNKK